MQTMNIQRVMIVGTMIVAMSFGGINWSKSTVNAMPVAKWSATGIAEKDDLLEALNQSSDEDLYEALYEGKSLNDIADEGGGDIETVINLQVAQLGKQLDMRLASGSITAAQHAVQQAELREIVTQSVRTSFG